MLRMEASDVRFLMLLAQREVQQHIRRKQIGVDNIKSFHLSYRERITGSFEHLFGLFVNEYNFSGGGSETLAIFRTHGMHERVISAL